ncbi:MAG: HAD-IC family P-type ATPase [Polyangiaceae bacterium]
MNAVPRTVETVAPESGARMRVESFDTCLHCGTALPSSERARGYCCTGCETLHALFEDAGLGRFYELGGRSGIPAPARDVDARDRKWLEPLEARLASATGLERIALDIQGLHCTGCVWVLEELFRRLDGGAGIVVNSARATLLLTVRPEFPLRTFVDTVERFGYSLGVPSRTAEPTSSDLLARLGVTVAIAMNSMIFAIATYAGLESGPVHRLVVAANFVLACISVVVGGTVFFRSAWQGLRRGILPRSPHRARHPVRVRRLHGLLRPPRRDLLRHPRRLRGAHADGAFPPGTHPREEPTLRPRQRRRGRSPRPSAGERRSSWSARTPSAACGDVLLVATGDLVVVPSRLVQGGGSFSLDWISGESRPVEFAEGDVVPAGAFSCASTVTTLVADDDFAGSPIVALLETPKDEARAERSPFWARFARVYVATVIVVAVLTGIGWALATHDAARTTSVVAAVLIVTCPCAFGIATPLAYELAQAGLRRRGLFVRSSSFLDRAVRVKRVAFDKTGTLTFGDLELADDVPLTRLPKSSLGVLRAMVSRSSHPKSRAILARLPSADGPELAELSVEERAGGGLVAITAQGTYRLGSPTFVGSGRGDVVFEKDGEVLADLVTAERLRPDTATEISRLRNEGYLLDVVSGDRSDRARAVARAIGIPADHVHAELDPAGKAAWVAAHDADDLLLVGDGINDGPAVTAAFASGTPAIERPFMAARTDFYVVTEGLRPIRLALAVAHRLRLVVRRNLAVALAYNLVTVTLAVSGRLSPLACAVLMPLSSLSTVLATTSSLSSRSRTWT